MGIEMSSDEFEKVNKQISPPISAGLPTPQTLSRR